MQLRPAFVILAAIASAPPVRAAQERAADAVPRAAFAASSIPAFLRNHDRAVLVSGAGGAGSLPARLDPSLFAFTVPEPAPGRERAAGLTVPGRRAPADAGARPDADDDDDDDDSASPSRPGTFTREPLKIPSRFLKTKTVAPHVNPDVSYDVNDRTSIGMFGEVNHVARGDTRATLTKPERDLGAGFTLQYKFGRP